MTITRMTLMEVKVNAFFMQSNQSFGWFEKSGKPEGKERKWLN